MHYYVRWGQVQERLRQWAMEHGEPIRFPDAVSLLWQEGQVGQGEQLPPAEFERHSWVSIEHLHQQLDDIPVDVTNFLEADFCADSPSEEFRQSLDAQPIKIAAYQREGLHAHEHYELLYMIQGEGGLRTEKGTVVCPEGTLCLIAPGMVHDVFAVPDSDAVSLAFFKESMESIFRKLLRHENIMSEFFHTSLDQGRQGYVLLYLPPDSQTRWLVSNIFAEGYSGEEYAREVCADYIELLLTYALRACADAPEAHVQRGRQAGVPMAAVMKYIQDHYRTTSLGEVAAAFHYDPDYLGKQIKRCMGSGYVELVLQLKLEEAKRLLRETEMTMDQIAQQTGLGSGVHLSRTFRKRFGMSPSEYYRECRKMISP